jgi:hypothetical protein
MILQNRFSFGFGQQTNQILCAQIWILKLRFGCKSWLVSIRKDYLGLDTG